LAGAEDLFYSRRRHGEVDKLFALRLMQSLREKRDRGSQTGRVHSLAALDPFCARVP